MRSSGLWRQRSPTLSNDVRQQRRRRRQAEANAKAKEQEAQAEKEKQAWEAEMAEVKAAIMGTFSSAEIQG